MNSALQRVNEQALHKPVERFADDTHLGVGQLRCATFVALKFGRCHQFGHLHASRHPRGVFTVLLHATSY